MSFGEARGVIELGNVKITINKIEDISKTFN